MQAAVRNPGEVVSSLVAVNLLVVGCPFVTVNPLGVVFELFGSKVSLGIDKVVVMLKNSGGCKLKSQQILRTSGGNLQLKRGMKLRPLLRLLLKFLLAEHNFTRDFYWARSGMLAEPRFVPE